MKHHAKYWDFLDGYARVLGLSCRADAQSRWNRISARMADKKRVEIEAKGYWGGWERGKKEVEEK